MGRPPEDAVREWRAILEADDTASLHNEHQRALCDSWLAQARVIEAARRDFHRIVTELSGWPSGEMVDRAREIAALAAGGETETPPEQKP